MRRGGLWWYRDITSPPLPSPPLNSPPLPTPLDPSVPPRPHNRALRPVRIAARLEGVRVVVLAIFMAAPAVAEVFLVASLFYFIFGVLGVNLFAGKFFMCTSQGSWLNPYYLVPEGNINSSW